MLWQRLCLEGVLVAGVAIGAAIDLRERHIPNWLTGSMLLGGLALSLAPVHLVSFAQALAGAAIGLALPLVLHILGGLAAGDVKLLAGIGAWVGVRGILIVIAGAALAGMVLVLAQALWEGRMRLLLRNTAVVAISLINLPRLGLAHVVETGQTSQSLSRSLPYALTVLIGMIGLLVMTWWQGGVW